MRRSLLIGIVLVLVVGAAGVTYAVTRSDQEDIFLESAGSVGSNPFTETAAVAETTTTLTPPSQPTTTALFGGTGDLYRCDPEAQIAFLTTHQDKAAAWIEALNSDPTLRWGPGGTMTKLGIGDIAAYIHELTPTHLLFDTRVTNWGYVNGKPVPHQALLQKGMAVLVDRYGIVRTKCRCGNPLTPPHKVDHPHWNGDCWPGCHDNPPCTQNCGETTTTEPPTTTTECQPLRTATAAFPDCATTSTRTPPPPPPPPPPSRQPTTTLPPAATTTLPPVTRTTVPRTTTTCGPNVAGC